MTLLQQSSPESLRLRWQVVTARAFAFCSCSCPAAWGASNSWFILVWGAPRAASNRECFESLLQCLPIKPLLQSKWIGWKEQQFSSCAVHMCDSLHLLTSVGFYKVESGVDCFMAVCLFVPTFDTKGVGRLIAPNNSTGAESGKVRWLVT